MSLLIMTVIYVSFSYGFISSVLSSYTKTGNITLLEMAIPFWLLLTATYSLMAFNSFKENHGNDSDE